MELLGSAGSPYVRRIRLLLGERDYRFTEMNIYKQDRDKLKAHNPVLKIPTLLDDGHTLFESRVIYRYLADKYDLKPLLWHDENAISVIDGANDAVVVLRLSQVSGLETDNSETMYFRLQHERVAECLDWLETEAAAGLFDAWHFPAMCLVSLVEWVDARGLVDVSGYTKLAAVCSRHADQPMVKATDPHNTTPPSTS